MSSEEDVITLQQNTEVNASSVFRYVELLFHNDGAVRKEARGHLVRIGRPAIPYMLSLLSHPHDHVRWEACKVLEKIRDPKTANALVGMLLDDDMDVRWVAADALIELEHHAIVPLLELLEEYFESVTVREAAHHILHSLKHMKLLDEKTEAVMDTLNNFEMPTRAAFAATAALDSLRGKKKNSKRRIAV